MAKIADVQEVAVSLLKPYENNAKIHGRDQLEKLKASIEEFGFLTPCLIDSDYNIIAGHGRVAAASEMGLESVPCVFIEGLTDAQRKAYILADNRLSELGEWDMDLVFAELSELDSMDFDVTLTGFDLPDEETVPDIVEDDFTEDVNTRCKLGDLWQLGDHRLICGDSTDPDVIDRLMDGVKADMVFTDPPFGVNVKGGKDKGNMIMGDLTQTAIPFSFEIAVTKCTKDKAHFYFCGAEANIQLYQKLFDRYLHILPKHLIWVKNGFVMKQNGYHNQFEIIYHGYKQGSGGLWYGGRTEDEASDVWHINRDASSTYLHPTQKPIGVPARAIKNSSPPSGSVVDLFGGSGSTLIACEQLNRKCFMCELDPHYCDVIIDRWEKFTGQKAKLESSADG